MDLKKLAELKKLKEQQLQLNNQIQKLETETGTKPDEKPTKPEEKPKEKTLDDVQKEHDEKRKAILLQEIADFDKRLNASNQVKVNDETGVKETAEGKERPRYVPPIPDFLKNQMKKDGRYDAKTGKYTIEKKWEE